MVLNIFLLYNYIIIKNIIKIKLKSNFIVFCLLKIMKKIRKMKVLVEISARHIHLNKRDFIKLFGKNKILKVIKELSQTNQFTTNDFLTIKTNKSKLKVRLLGPIRKYSQVEISMTEAIKLGIKTDIRLSGDIKGVKRIEVIGPKGKCKIPVIIAKRHLHCPTTLAKKKSLKNMQKVAVKINGERSLIFNEVIVRTDDDYNLAVHLDTDEGDAAGLKGAVIGELLY